MVAHPPFAQIPHARASRGRQLHEARRHDRDAALYRCLVRLVHRRPDMHADLTGASRAIVAENLWRAQADGVRAELR